mmetsp:Transcript_31585/g.50376  ORF Transcript_31585/g.50376 Transcript_31585/m.50376 type:complete len:249 (+) Transcript_31585:575-1321(+)
MMQEDTHLSIFISLVPEGVFNLGDSIRAGTCKVVSAHSNGSCTIQINLMIFELYIGPAFAAIDCKPAIFIVALLNSITPHEVGHSIRSSWAKRMHSSLRGLKQHIGVPIAIQLACCVSSCAYEVTFFCMNLGYILDSVCPRCLAFQDLVFGNRVWTEEAHASRRSPHGFWAPEHTSTSSKVQRALCASRGTRRCTNGTGHLRSHRRKSWMESSCWSESGLHLHSSCITCISRAYEEDATQGHGCFVNH